MRWKRKSEEVYGLIEGNGWEKLRRRIREAIEEDGFLFILIIGERGKGKSTLALNIMQHIYGEERLVRNAVVFTPDDYDSLVFSRRRYRSLRADDGRIKAILWDDIGVHFSTYKWFTPHQRQRMIEFLEDFQAVREDVAVLVGTVVEEDMLPPKLRSAANYIVDCVKRGYGKVHGYTRVLWLKTWKVRGEIRWSKAEPGLYTWYRSMKRRAHRAKQRARTLTRTKLVKAYAEVLSSLDGELDFETLYGLGIVNIRGEITPFGKVVLAKAGLDESYVEEILEADSL